MHYFAYGSNMLSARLEARVSILGCQGRALLPGYQLYCDKVSMLDHSGKFTIAGSHGDQVEGVLYEIPESALEPLDQFEGDGYRRIHIEVDAPNLGIISAISYEALPDCRDPGLKPYDWYRALAVAGAMEHELSQAYIHHLQLWPITVDPDRDRDAKNRALINSSSL